MKSLSSSLFYEIDIASGFLTSSSLRWVLLAVSYYWINSCFTAGKQTAVFEILTPGFRHRKTTILTSVVYGCIVYTSLNNWTSSWRKSKLGLKTSNYVEKEDIKVLKRSDVDVGCWRGQKANKSGRDAAAAVEPSIDYMASLIARPTATVTVDLCQVDDASTSIVMEESTRVYCAFFWQFYLLFYSLFFCDEPVASGTSYSGPVHLSFLQLKETEQK